MRFCILAAVSLLSAGSATAASRDVGYGPIPAWVNPPPKATDAETPAGAPMRMIYADQQARVDAEGVATYIAFRVKILSPEALQLGNFYGVWNPDSGDLTMHHLRIIRDGTVIDVLKDNRPKVIQRESNLELAMLDGRLTATLQAPGVQVGDEIEAAATVRHRDITLKDTPSGLMQLPVTGTLGAYRVRLIWPKSLPIRWEASPDLATVAPTETAGEWQIVHELRDPNSALLTDGAPLRFNNRRQIQFSSFASWAQVSSLVWPLFEQASTLAPNSPIRAEAAKIAAATSDPAARAEAALRLVQERIRYVYVGLDGGNYRPAAADETWNRRFGDCKAKTVILMALLRELGVANEAVLVRIADDNGTDKALASPSAFDHVLVRASVGGRQYWLDGVRMGDQSLSRLPEPTFRWALPLRSAQAALEPVEAKAPLLPQEVTLYEQDSRRGFDAPAKMRVTKVYRGDAALPLRTQLASLRPEDAERALKGFWKADYEWIEPEDVAWRYDEAAQTLTFELKGEGDPDWEGDDRQGRSLRIAGAGFNPPSKLRRPAEQDQTAPWVVDFPHYKCWISVIRLPPAAGRWRWDFISAPVDRELGGDAYWRRAALEDGVMRTVMSRRSLVPEITAAQAKEVNDSIAGFDNRVSMVFQTRGSGGRRAKPDSLGAIENTGWSGGPSPCARSQETAAAK